VPWLSRRLNQNEFLERVFVHADALYRYAYRLAGDRQTAEDLVQESLVRALQAFGGVRPDTQHRAWVFTILRNTFLSQLRKHREEVVEDPEPAALDASPEGVLELRGGGLGDEVQKALDRLPESQRTALVLCDVEGMTYEEIAQVMTCPVGTVRSRIHHARRRLRLSLGGYARGVGYGRVDEAM
jgi:RNA polymerase sigma-70 factor (ECF subfamily)